ncbi:cyanobacterial aminoacyl-tRNA synthetase, CAAD domain-containing protein [Artemisia annua]|uniref:Cyanobacterial aminoacyl-tRNA synthetase, CAAD domain-containing protein n=1 Tax=Artemisia annua TaxID=35608 RepID=A0A2U1PH82_ARTAN|nr:cyanobacterial aminoacyl-tRNA synthetase, CAAD domain-containing protein [Artemisia annua]
MVLCTSSPSTRFLPKFKSNLTSYRTTTTSHHFKPSLPLKPASNNQGLRYYKYASIRAKASDEISSGANQYVKDEPEVVDYSSLKATTNEETANGANQYVKEESDSGVTVKEESDSDVTVEEAQAEEKSGFGGFSLFSDGAAADNELPQFEFLDKLKVELDLQDSFSIALLAVTGVSALWLTVSIVGAIDRVPLFPKLMEVVGLGYSIWFSSRYLLFKRNRDELASKIEEIKQQVLGPKN